MGAEIPFSKGLKSFFEMLQAKTPGVVLNEYIRLYAVQQERLFCIEKQHEIRRQGLPSSSRYKFALII